MKYHCYLCYNSKDYTSVEDFYNLFSATGLKVFFCDNIQLSGQSVDKILVGLAESQSLIVLISKNGCSSTWQKYEIDTFLTSYHIPDVTRRIFVILLEKISEDIIPTSIKGFERYEYFDKVNYNHEHIFNLTQELQPNEALYKRLYIERPLLKNVYKNELLKPTLTWYHNNAEQFFETWKNEIPEAAINNFIYEVKKFCKGKKANILDAGCGPGHHSNYLSKQNFDVTGVDFASNAIEIAEKNKVAGTYFIYGDIRNLEAIFRGNRNIFDGIWAAASLVHLNYECLVLQFYQFVAHLKPEGILGVTFQIGFDSEVGEDGRFFEKYKNGSFIRKKLEEVGFIILKEIIDYEGKSTTRKKIKTWLCFIAKAPSYKKILTSKRECT